MSTKLRIRIGEVEIDYEGSEEFLKQELPDILTKAMELHQDSHVQAQESGGTGNTRGNVAETGPVPSLTTENIAVKLGAESGSDLLKAAAAHLSLVKGQTSFSRKQLLTEMQSATSYYKKSYSKNLTRYIGKALKDDLLSEIAKGSYALTANARKELERTLVNN